MSWHGCSAAKSPHQQLLDDQEFRKTLDLFVEMRPEYLKKPLRVFLSLAWKDREMVGTFVRLSHHDVVYVWGETGKSTVVKAINQAISHYYKQGRKQAK